MTDMLHVYSRAGEPWLLVPAAQAPTREARVRYGRLAYVGAFASHRLSTEEYAQVMVQCDAASVSAVPSRTALRLLAPVDAQWQRHLRRWLPRTRRPPRGERAVIGGAVASALPPTGDAGPRTPQGVRVTI